MDLDRTPSEISFAMAEEARALNHRTLNPKVFEAPSDIAYTADGITALIQRLPQALQQLQAGLETLHADERIRLADRPPHQVTQNDIDRAVFNALCALHDAEHTLATVEERLRSAGRVLGNLGAPWPEDDGED
ncbi:hypothetical protein ACL07V_37545 [Streptomyces sp. MB22_4]|uniref:hypothetical protein n=1 Tax=Streptomyces sp. MB22_4 TaxID=3383120 RepID=UPI0039A07AE2